MTMYSLFQLAAFIGLASTAAISPISVPSVSLDTKRDNNKPSGHFTSLSFPPLLQQPSFCPYDKVNNPQPLLSYDESTAPQAADCAHIIEMLTKRNLNNPNFIDGVKGYWTFDVSALKGKGINLISHKSCVFRLQKGDGEPEGVDGGNKKPEQFNFGVEELKTYLGGWLEKQRHGLLGAVGETDCWVEGKKKKEEGGVKIKWVVGKVGEGEEKAVVEVLEWVERVVRS